MPLCGENERFNIKQMFHWFWTREMCGKMIQATNAYGNAYIRGWKDMTETELDAFLGIVTYLGCCSYPSRKEVWRAGIKGSALIKRIMTLRRFEAICRAWHCRDQTVYTASALKALKDADPYWAVKDFVTELSNNYEKHWTPGQFIDIDEQTILWKGRHKCRTYNPNKPEKWHLKVFSLNCSLTGYQCAFYLYQGKSEQRPPLISATAYPAYVLLQNEKYHNNGYVLFRDNWFTSFQQLEICRSRGIDMVGTIKKQRAGMPETFRQKTSPLRIRGQNLTQSSVVQGKQVWCSCWSDKKPVYMLHTIPTTLGSCNREVNRGGVWQRVQYQRPTIIKLYNSGMGGTDAGDQRMQSYRTTLKTRSWIPRVLSHCLNSTIVNLFIFGQKTFGEHPDFPRTHLRFRDALIDYFFQKTLQENILDPSKRHQHSQSKMAWNSDIFRRTGQHFAHIRKRPEENRTEGTHERTGAGSNIRNYFRGNCMMCNRYISTRCMQCSVYLCLISEGDEDTCFSKFHTNANIFDCSSIAVEITSSSDD